MEKKDSQHVQLPNNMTRSKVLSPNDLWVYVCIKSYDNPKKDCYPSLKTISEKSGFSIPTIRDSIERLRVEGCISIVKFGRQQKYYFQRYEHFEVFSYAFIDKKDISPKEKAYLVSIQQFMFKDTEGVGKVEYSDKELADRLNTSINKIATCNQNLSDLGYLSMINDGRDKTTGVMIRNKYFHLDELGQAIVFSIKSHESKLVEHQEKLEEHDIKINNILKKNEALVRSNKILMKDYLNAQREIEKLSRLLSGNVEGEIII